MKGIAAESSKGEGGAVDVVAHSLQQLATLSFDDSGLLLVSAIQSQVDKFLWLFSNFVSFLTHSLHQVKRHWHDQFNFFGFKDFVISHFRAKDRNDIDQFNNQIWVVLVLNQTLQFRVSSERDQSLDHRWGQTLSLGNQRTHLRFRGFFVVKDKLSQNMNSF